MLREGYLEISLQQFGNLYFALKKFALIFIFNFIYKTKCFETCMYPIQQV